MVVVGGFGEEREVTAEVRALVLALKTDIESVVGEALADFEPIVFASQVVAGTNYAIKVRVGQGRIVEARVFKPLPHTKEGPRLIKASLVEE